MDIKKQVEYFTQLPYETRRDKVLDMLKQLQWTHEVFAMFYKTVHNLNQIADNVLIYLYQSILEIAEELTAWRKEEAQDKIKRMAEVLMMIKKQEEMEREREGNPDDLVKNM